MAAQPDDSVVETNRINLHEVLKFLERTALQDETDFAATGDERKRRDAEEKHAKASTIRALLALRAGN